jgi:molybdate transport system substrate-binding protein
MMDLACQLRYLLIVGLLLGTACGGSRGTEAKNNPVNGQLTIYAAASLVEAFSQIGEEFEAARPSVKVVISFAGSQQIAQQVSQGAPGDLFASADVRQMENVINSGMVEPGSQREFIHNQLVVILPEDNPGQVYEFGDLARPSLEIIIAAEEVPVGAYSMQMLERANQQPGLGSEFKAKVQGNVVSYEENVRAVLTKIVLGEAEAGIVYMSDIDGIPEAELQVIPIPEEINISASYYIAPLVDSPNKQLAEDFISLVLSPNGQEILSDHGFVKLDRNE